MIMTTKTADRKGHLFGMKWVWRAGLTAIFLWMAPCVDSQVEAADRESALAFEKCVELALKESPFLKQSALNIEIRRLDESDARWSLFPHFHVQSSYALTRRYEEVDDGRNWAISFTTGPYDPLRSYFTMKVHELIKEVAIQSHLEVIRKGIFDLYSFIISELQSTLLSNSTQQTAGYDESVGYRERNIYHEGKAGGFVAGAGRTMSILEHHNTDRIRQGSSRTKTLFIIILRQENCCQAVLYNKKCKAEYQIEIYRCIYRGS